MIEWSCSDGVGTAVIARPEQRNALDAEHCEELTQVLTRGDARAIVITGAGTAFSAGADLRRRAQHVGAGTEDSLNGALRALLDTIVEAPVPVIAAVNGPAIGAGLQLALTCDFRVAGPGARFAIPAARLGIVVDFVTVRRIVARVGGTVARELLVAARTFDCDEAMRNRIVDRCADDAAESAREWARELASLAPLTLAAHKLMLHEIERASDLDAMARAAIDGIVAQARGSDDLREGMRAFIEKRAPRFEGR